MPEHYYCLLILGALILYVLYRKFYMQKPRRSGGCSRMQGRPAAAAVRGAPAPAPGGGYDHNNYLLNEGVSPDVFQSQQQFVDDTYTNALLLGSSKDIVNDLANDINPQWGLRRINYDVPIGEGARQVPSDYRDQLPNVQAPSFV